MALSFALKKAGGASAPTVAPVATFVAAHQGLPFKNPVTVHQVPASAYAKELARNGVASTSTQQQEVTDTLAQLRAVGLVGADADPAKVLAALHEAPVQFGTRFVRVARLVGMMAGVDRAMEVSPASDQQIFDPFQYVNATQPLQVDAPPVPPGAKQVATGELGATLWYLMLASHGRPIDALDAVDGWAGDRYTSYRLGNGTVCTDINFRGASDTATASMLVALGAWQRALAPGQATVTQNGLELVVHACDPGAKAKASGDRSVADLALPLTRTDIAADLYDKGKHTPNGPNGPVYTPDQARCVGDAVVHQLSEAELERYPSKSALTARLVALALPGCMDASSSPSTP